MDLYYYSPIMKKSIKKPVRRTTVRTIRKKAKKISGKKHRDSTNTDKLSQTIEISDGSIFNDISVARATFLDVKPTGSKGFRVPLNDDVVVIGRDASCRIPLPLPNVSREHARVVSHAEEYILEDMDSTNGTFVNNIRVSRCVLRNNDYIRIGETNIIFAQQKVRKYQ
ncbi:MAG: FHA domain-containing protein [Kiritimatiellae bacterium]|nr:FHA domain-containing protein [Kiritimatiellia bacterium]